MNEMRSAKSLIRMGAICNLIYGITFIIASFILKNDPSYKEYVYTAYGYKKIICILLFWFLALCKH